MDVMKINDPCIFLEFSGVSANEELPTNTITTIITNLSNFVVYVKAGETNAVTADNGDTPIPPRTQVSYSKEYSQVYMAAYSEEGSGTIVIQCGGGY